MLYLKNSLVNLTIILFSLFFLTILPAEESNFIFPKKKINTIKANQNKQGKIEINKNSKLSDLPPKKPFQEESSPQKKLRNNIKDSQITKKNYTKNKITFSGKPVKVILFLV